MRIGASTSCFFPQETEKGLEKIVELGFERAEVFFNAPCELENEFTDKINSIVADSETKIISVHPYSSFLETNCIFGGYQRMYDDFIGIYEKTCYAAARIGAKYVVIHGAIARPKIPIPDERYFERFRKLIDIGKKEGVTVCQENVNLFKSQSIDFCKKMRAELGGDYNMVFDIKQTKRANQDTFEFLNEFKNEIRHIHISDNGPLGDCLPIGYGDFDFKKFKKILDDAEYKGDCVIEIYSKQYDVAQVLKESKANLEKLWQV